MKFLGHITQDVHCDWLGNVNGENGLEDWLIKAWKCSSSEDWLELSCNYVFCCAIIGVAAFIETEHIGGTEPKK